MSPSALNAPAPISKGGTGATTAAGAATALAAAFGNLLFPIGSIYSNTSNSTNPGTLLGFGTWTALGAGRMLMGSGGAYGIGTTGGSADAVVVSHTHTATVTDPGHFHTMSPAWANSGASRWSGSAGAIGNTVTQTDNAVTGITVANSTVGVSATNANLPPYLVVYMWQRTA
jgi:hypothetical protein